MMQTRPNLPPLNRREFLARSGMGMGSLALAGMVNAGNNSMEPGSPHFAAKAKRVVHIFCNGGPSQVDTFDPKPLLDKWHGKKLPTKNLRTERKTGAAFRSPFKFKRFGRSGIPVSDLFPKTAQCVDDLCVIRSMHADVPNHEPSLMLMNCGDGRLIRPSMGSWVTYGLGTENQNLPGFIAMCPGGYPIKESQNWNSAFLPGVYQGTYIDPKNTRDISKLVANIRNSRLGLDDQRRQLDLLNAFNQLHLRERTDDSRLDARIHSFELAYRMQMEATDAFDITREPGHIRKLYGDSMHGREFLITRRLIERGVRYVQLWHGAGQPWDNHDNIESGHRELANHVDQPIAALLTDLKQRGMLEDTLVIWGGEFGRTPVVELPKPGSNQGKINGRDHNHHGFSIWMAGGGVKGGYIHGSTDEFGFRAEDKPVHVHDLQATILHLLGFDHERLTYRYSGRDFRLTDVHGEVVHDLIA
jgi:hypothetical protein